MGARVNFIFNDGTPHAVGLYSHWGADSWEHDLAQAIKHAEPRLGDTSYWTRMVISHLIQNELLDETGYGIFACDPNDFVEAFDECVEIDLINNRVNGYSFESMFVWQGV
jgi:hypothetical protein